MEERHAEIEQRAQLHQVGRWKWQYGIVLAGQMVWEQMSHVQVSYDFCHYPKKEYMIVEEAFGGDNSREWVVDMIKNLQDWEVDEYEELLYLLDDRSFQQQQV